jgi:hypothetical protein
MWKTEKDTAERYLESVKQCLTDEKAFDKFKSNNDYISIVGMSQPWQAVFFYDKIREYPEIYSKIKDLVRNDTIGNPIDIMEFRDIKVSPNTLRHINTLCDLYHHFGNLDGKIISELGVGYGATAFMVNTCYKPTSYHLIDLPDVQSFALKYLNKFGINATMETPPQSVDIFISEFCLSEFDDIELYSFYDKYVKDAKNTYLMMNLHDEQRKQAFIHRMTEDFDVEILPEYPVTHWPNYIIVGKK